MTSSPSSTPTALWRHPLLGALVFGMLCIGVYIVQLLDGVPPMEPTPAQLFQWGGNLSPLTLNGESWRLLTSMFVHVGLIHLAANMFMLFTISPVAARRFGGAGFTVIYLVGGLASSVVSTWWSSLHLYKTSSALGSYSGMFAPAKLQLIVSVGASGAIMAVCGALAGIWMGTAGRVEPSATDAKFHQDLIKTIGINIVLGFAITGIDQAAHLGGLVAGWLLGTAMGVLQTGGNPALRWARMAGGAVAVAAASWGLMVAANTEQVQDVARQLHEEPVE